MKKQNHEIDLSRIAGLLSYGSFMGDSRKKVISLTVAIVFICLFVLALAVIRLSIDFTNSSISVLSFVSGLISFIIGLSVLPIFTVFIVVKNERIRNEVELWVADSVEVTANATSVGTKRKYFFPATKLQIDFVINGIHYSRTSDSRKTKGNNFEGGYYYIWSKYADRKVKILYSLKYDQVMVLKDD